MKLQPGTILKRSNAIELKVDSMQSVEVIVNNKSERMSNKVLVILDEFSSPVSINDTLKKLQANNRYQWIELAGTINKLYELGALLKGDEAEIESDRVHLGFGSAPVHTAMLNDKVRTQTFINAINEVVKEGDVVVDIGTGTGVLAIAAARAGARKVYAIEVSLMADVAQAVINSTEVASKITIVRGWSTQVELPEKADVLVSEIIGDDPLTESILPIYKDARRRLLKPGAKILPKGIKIFGVPVEISGEVSKNKVLRNEYLESWKNWYGIDFRALKNLTAPRSAPILKLSTTQAEKIKNKGDSMLLADIDFSIFEEVGVSNSITGKATHPFNGLLIYFELDMGTNVLTTHPQFADKTNHWLNPVWYLPQAEEIKTGGNFTIKFISGAADSEIHFNS